MPRALYALIPLLLVAAAVGGYFALRPSSVPEAPVAPASAPGPDAPQPTPPAGAPKAKLAVLIVFDQMRGDYMTRWADLYGPDGFERMKKDGAWFSECHVPYACTSTAPGHASLSTGAPPSVHGIIENEWYDRETKKRMYCCQPKLLPKRQRPYDLVPPVPAALDPPGRGSVDGFSPERLLAQTVGESLQAETKGKGRVFTLSLKDRTAVLMGGQKPTGAYCFDIRDGLFHTGEFYERDAPHPWVTEFNRGKPADAWFGKDWERLKPEDLYVKHSGPDGVAAESPGYNQGRVFPHPYSNGLTVPAQQPYYRAVECSPAGNELLLALTKKCVTAEKLGRGDSPDLLCVSFSSNDVIGHAYGPDSQEMLDITLRADRIVADLLKFLDDEVGKDRYTLVLAADHGVCPLPELETSKAKYPAATRKPVLDLKGVPVTGLAIEIDAALTAMYGREGNAPTQWFEAFDGDTWPWLYLNHEAITARKLKVEDVAEKARDVATGRGYIETAFTRKELEDRNAPDVPFRSAARLAYHPDRCGDVIIIPKAGVLVTDYKLGTSHGSPQPYDAHIPFLAYGAGVPALGKRTEKVSSLSVAPTLAWALGVPAPKHAAAYPPEALKK